MSKVVKIKVWHQGGKPYEWCASADISDGLGFNYHSAGKTRVGALIELDRYLQKVEAEAKEISNECPA